MKKKFEPVTYYQDAEAAAEEEEAKFRKALAGLEVDWPERVDAGIRERLQKLDGTGGNDWQVEVEARMQQVGEK
ncbi:MAG: hypothetical protein EXS31_09230 [Pedosphaera sp.]|nr:hypothetical protein [Pedosphaera sp.]